jgi:hypothetical protein
MASRNPLDDITLGQVLGGLGKLRDSIGTRVLAEGLEMLREEKAEPSVKPSPAATPGVRVREMRRGDVFRLNGIEQWTATSNPRATIDFYEIDVMRVDLSVDVLRWHQRDGDAVVPGLERGAA